MLLPVLRIWEYPSLSPFVMSALSSPPPVQEERWWKAQKPMTSMALEFPWRKESIRTHPDHLLYLANPPHAHARAVNSSDNCPGRSQRRARAWPVDAVGEGRGRMGGRTWSKCFTTWTSELWSSKESATWRQEKKKKVERLLRDIVFCAHTSHSSSTGGRVLTLRFQFC